MANANVNLGNIDSETTYSNANTISILNSHASDGLRVQKSVTEYIVLKSGESVSLNAQTGFVLPPITIKADGGSISAQIITS